MKVTTKPVQADKAKPTQQTAAVAVSDSGKRKALMKKRAFYNLPWDKTLYTVLDNGTDRSYVNDGWIVLKIYDEKVLDHDNIERTLVDAMCTVVQPYPERRALYIVRVNRAIYAPESESILTPEQVRWCGHTVNLTPIQFGGAQNIIGTGFNIPLYFNGETLLFYSQKTKECHRGLPKVELTSSLPYSPRDFLMREADGKVNDPSKAVDPADSAELLDEPLFPLSPLDGDSMDYIWDTSGHHWKPHQLAEWQKRLAFVPDEAIKKTFIATTQLVPSIQHENELYPKDAQGARFPILSCRRLKEAVYCDIVKFPRITEKQTRLEMGLLVLL